VANGDDEGRIGCIFCQVAAARVEAPLVLEDPDVVVFLDHRPLFAGHCLVIPRRHYESLAELPPGLASRLFEVTRLIAGAMEKGLQAEGAFVAINNRVSQSVPHVHIHVVPRRQGDGLKGFFWPRRKYRDSNEVEQVRAALHMAVKRMQEPGSGGSSV